MNIKQHTLCHDASIMSHQMMTQSSDESRHNCVKYRTKEKGDKWQNTKELKQKQLHHKDNQN